MSSLKERVATAAAGLSLIAFAQACEKNGKEVDTPTSVPTIEKTHVPTSIPEPTTTPITFPIPEGEYKINLNVVASKIAPQDKEFDQQCGVLLNLRESTRIDFPFQREDLPQGVTVSFDLNFEKTLDGKYIFANVVVENEGYFSLSMPNLVVPLGKFVIINQETGFFMPYKDRIFDVVSCEIDQESPAT